ncbi:hypothetical protein QSU92_14275 [Microbacterium sp. ET2]|uniref:hypothetical protein n=1 Tax=Microbacterium albipurpureum TaxID=3050384 RepID=UPI00259C9C74|nr:hypothetical protein [Microbacterium sp. ET2 (Ac-2212)]WJL95102.1 hypothetical protein QSU92_14275 [Microbacterium sp. ET2 (Ac-2212)]
MATAIVGAVRFAFNRDFYFADDSQTGAFGQWWELGDHLLQGRIPVLEPYAWQAGNYFAEGQWGLLNPVTWLVALGARAMEEPTLHGAIVKIAFLMIMSGGVFLLARSFGAGASWSALAGLLVPMSGFTVYMDATSWATGLFNAAVFPWVWWALRRLAEDGRSPWPYLVSSYVLITFGYVFGVLILIVVLVESLIRAVVARDRGRILRVLAASVWGGLLTIAIYLPALLTAPVTERAGFEILNTWFLSADLTDLASTASPMGSASIGSWWGPVTDAPLVYIAWILPFVPLFLPMARDAARRCIPLLVLATIVLLIVVGPSDVGPIRWPVRFMPYLALPVVILVAVMATRTFPSRITRRGIAWSGALIVLTALLSYGNTPGGWKGIATIVIVQAAALCGLVFVAWEKKWPATERTRTVIAVGAGLVVTVLLVVPQLLVFPATPLPKFAVPDSVSRMSAVVSDAPGDAIVVGDIYADGGREASFDERLLGNLWYLSPAHVGSLYTVLPYSRFSNDLCSDLRGSTCDEALETLWSTDPDTGLPVADLMGVSTIIAMKETFPRAPDAPAGWRIVDDGDFTWRLERSQPIPGAGGVVYTGTGTEVTTIAQSDTAVTLRVDDVGDDGRIVLSRLDYPGYSVDGAGFDQPVRGWLLTVDASGAAPGDVITVRFRPPGFGAMIAAYILCAALVAGWMVVRFRQRAGAPVAGNVPPAPTEPTEDSAVPRAEQRTRG